MILEEYELVIISLSVVPTSLTNCGMCALWSFLLEHLCLRNWYKEYSFVRLICFDTNPVPTGFWYSMAAEYCVECTAMEKHDSRKNLNLKWEQWTSLLKLALMARDNISIDDLFTNRPSIADTSFDGLFQEETYCVYITV